MSLRFTRKHLIILGSSTIFLIGLSFLLIYLFVKPVEIQNESIQSSIAMQQKFLDILNEKQVENTAPVVSSTELQKKIPVIPLVEQVILDLEKAENVSNSKISNMSFSESDFYNPVEEEDTSTDEQVDAAPESSPTTDSEETFDPTLLEGLKQVIVTITVESPGYRELENFLSLIEHQTRITKVDSLNFTGKQEVTSIEQNIDEPLVYAITLSTFYMSAYPELAENAPEINVPEPDNKKNPLFTNSADEEDEDQ